MVLSNRKGVVESASGGGGAAFLVLVITLLVIFYILFLSPSDRAALLGDGAVPGTPPTVSGGYSHLVGSVPFSQAIGDLTYVRESTIEQIGRAHV